MSSTLREICSKLDSCPKVLMILDKAWELPELYGTQIKRMCSSCNEYISGGIGND